MSANLAFLMTRDSRPYRLLEEILLNHLHAFSLKYSVVLFLHDQRLPYIVNQLLAYNCLSSVNKILLVCFVII